MKAVTVVLTFFSLWLSPFLSRDFEQYLGIFLILTIGVLHGANDIGLISRLSKKPTGDLQNLRPLAAYILIVLVGAFLFYSIPAAILPLFVGVSAYHFGQQHWIGKSKNDVILQVLFSFFYGAVILSLLFYLNSTEVQEIIIILAGISLSVTFFENLLYIAGSVLILISLIAYLKKGNKILIEIGHLLILAIFFNAVSLIWGFAVYFVLWHSIPSLKDQIFFLYGSNSISALKYYLKTSLIYWGISLLGLCVITFLFWDQDQIFAPLLFSFLAAITFPHVIVIDRIQNS